MIPLWGLWVLFGVLFLMMVGAGVSEKTTGFQEVAERRVILQWSFLVLLVAVWLGIVATGIVSAVTS